MEVLIGASFLLIGLLCGFFVSIVGFLAIIFVWFAVIASVIYAGSVDANASLIGAVIAMALGQLGFLVGAVILRKLNALKMKLPDADSAAKVEPSGKNML
jgi:hypothetical protein